jgi:RNA methyltransferase, TrmH family
MQRLGDHAPRLSAARALLTRKGRRGELFVFEGETLLDEALRSALEIDAVYATQAAYDASPTVQSFDGKRLWIVSERAAQRLSDVDTPSGIAVVARRPLVSLERLIGRPGPVLALADLADPGNAGTLVRAGEAFGAAGVVFGRSGVDPFHPKVIRAAMGSIFRLPVAEADPSELAGAASAARRPVAGLTADGGGSVTGLPAQAVLVVGGERSGLGAWEKCCTSLFRIPMQAGAESLNAGVAGAIALYEATRGRPE